MDNSEQSRRERAYKIWEDEGRVEGAELEHWHRAGEESQDERDASEVTEANLSASEKFAKTDGDSPSAVDIRTVVPPAD